MVFDLTQVRLYPIICVMLNKVEIWVVYVCIVYRCVVVALRLMMLRSQLRLIGGDGHEFSHLWEISDNFFLIIFMNKNEKHFLGKLLNKRDRNAFSVI